jgi:hypothetical protein
VVRNPDKLRHLHCALPLPRRCASIQQATACAQVLMSALGPRAAKAIGGGSVSISAAPISDHEFNGLAARDHGFVAIAQKSFDLSTICACAKPAAASDSATPCFG